MINKTTGWIITIVTGVLFGCPGLFLLAFGILAFLTNSENPSPTSGVQVAIVSLLFGVILVIVPIAVGFFVLRTKPEEPASNEPLSPE